MTRAVTPKGAGALYRKVGTCAAVAAELGCSVETIRRRLKRAKIQRDGKRGPKPEHRRTPAQIAVSIRNLAEWRAKQTPHTREQRLLIDKLPRGGGGLDPA